MIVLSNSVPRDVGRRLQHGDELRELLRVPDAVVLPGGELGVHLLRRGVAGELPGRRVEVRGVVDSEDARDRRWGCARWCARRAA